MAATRNEHYTLKPGSLMGLDLLQQGAVALGEVESNGIRVDSLYLKNTIVETRNRIKSMVEELCDDEIGKAWIKRFEGNVNFQAREQLAEVLQMDLGIKLPKTDKGNDKTDVGVLFDIEHPFIQKYVRINQLKKALSTYLIGINKEAVNGYLHPFFNLHRVITYRSSSSDINFQNIPARDAEISAFIRRAFVPRKGRSLIETDYGGIEVCISACYNQDPTLIAYILDPTKDMHRDMAAQCYMIPPKEVVKATRTAAKSFWTFAQFYGDYFAPCARNLWKEMVKKKFKTVSGDSVKKILRANGITELGEEDSYGSVPDGTFMAHLQQVEDHFWNTRFKVYQQWKDDWYEQYLEQGWISTLTGFVCAGNFKRNQIINFPVQGSAFHCLLRSLVRLVKFHLKKAKMKTLIVGQIHDSIVADVPHEETEDYCALVQHVMVEELMAAWKWIIVPIKIEITKYDDHWGQKRVNIWNLKKQIWEDKDI